MTASDLLRDRLVIGVAGPERTAMCHGRCAGVNVAVMVGENTLAPRTCRSRAGPACEASRDYRAAPVGSKACDFAGDATQSPLSPCDIFEWAAPSA